MNVSSELSSFAAKTLKPGQTIRITLRGSSMSPYLRDGDVLEVKKEMSLHPGEIVVFDLHGMLVAHRILEISETTITAKGDASRQSEQVKAEEIAGKVIAVLRGPKRIKVNSRRARLYHRLLPWSSLALRAYRKLLRAVKL